MKYSITDREKKLILYMCDAIIENSERLNTGSLTLEAIWSLRGKLSMADYCRELGKRYEELTEAEKIEFLLRETEG